MSSKRSSDNLSVVLAILFLLAAGAGILYAFRWTPAQSVDVYYRAGWMVAHWNDRQAFPPGSELCTAPFCTRADTTQKYAGGWKRHRSETYYPYCPEHNPVFAQTGSKLDGLIRTFYWLIAIGLSFIVGGLALTLLCFPAAAIYEATRQSPESQTFLRRSLDRSVAMGVTLTFPVALLAWLMFAWW
jgi:hypothetical protein